MRARWLALGFFLGASWVMLVEACRRAIAEINLMIAVMHEDQVREVHTIPVPVGWSPEQAWEVIMRGERIPEDVEICWANVDGNGHLL